VSAVTGNQIGVAGAQALAKALESNHTLTTLDLFGARPIAVFVVAVFACVGCDGCKGVVVSECSTVLSAVSGNQIGDAGAQTLARGLESNRTLTTLILSCTCPTAVFVVAVFACVCCDGCKWSGE
jgi:hypothetical protein